MTTELKVIHADWPAPDQVHACVTTRCGGVSQGPYAGLNLAQHVEDNVDDVARNRQLLHAHLDLPGEPCWLDQVHGVVVTDAGDARASRQADAAFTELPNTVCSVLTADCLPVLICNRRGTKVAAAHAGWRGLHAGVIEHTLQALREPADQLLAWLGPAIGPQAFEVGDEVKQAFESDLAAAAQAFQPTRPGHWLADMYLLARQRLQAAGVQAIYGGGLCTYTDAEHFYSYRREGKTGRMASLIWMGDNS